VSDQVSHPYETTPKIVILCNIHVFTEETVRQNILNWMVASIPKIQFVLNFFVNAILFLSLSFPNIRILSHFRRVYWLPLYYGFELHSSKETGVHRHVGKFVLAPK
jgi:hypothetical protein